MPRPVWSGTISFGLVTIPVKLFHAVSRKNVSFNQLDDRSMSRIRMKKVSAETGEDVPDEHWDRVSQEMIEESRRMSFEEVLRGAEESRARARSVWGAVSTVSEEAADFFAGETSEHYDEHRAEIQTFRKRGRERG
jgi:hypothetical protein